MLIELSGLSFFFLVGVKILGPKLKTSGCRAYRVN